ncbi:methylated-DNA--[protein]-cysteine S-methyltransferase [Zobellella maritima]|uniref:methylated-DNA--[protein]-cysteine S-methyltransferase n=1 Tax=Zobellella maritima TaxID=2059725 RepID=UPI000E302033|nr:methylated-DNA--[protein]-cysteine S-methyltransferase [Zobellella maritima]
MYCTLSGPCGQLKIIADPNAIVRIDFLDQPEPEQPATTPLLSEASAQLKAYFAGSLHSFSLPLAPKGTRFQQQVWQALQQLAYGERCSYREIALRIGNPLAVRAVGAANGRNPIPIVIPCHRVIGANGKLTGYAGGLERKDWLLRHEAGLAASIGGRARSR